MYDFLRCFNKLGERSPLYITFRQMSSKALWEDKYLILHNLEGGENTMLIIYKPSQ